MFLFALYPPGDFHLHPPRRSVTDIAPRQLPHVAYPALHTSQVLALSAESEHETAAYPRRAGLALLYGLQRKQRTGEFLLFVCHNLLFLVGCRREIS